MPNPIPVLSRSPVVVLRFEPSFFLSEISSIVSNGTKNNTFGEKLEITSVFELAWAKREKSRETMNVRENCAIEDYPFKRSFVFLIIQRILDFFG